MFAKLIAVTECVWCSFVLL